MCFIWNGNEIMKFAEITSIVLQLTFNNLVNYDTPNPKFIQVGIYIDNTFCRPTNRTLVGKKIVDHSEVVEAAPTATISSFST